MVREEKNIIKLIKNGNVVGQATFTKYEVGLKYAVKKCEEGYTCLILRMVNDKEWVKLTMYPPENL